MNYEKYGKSLLIVTSYIVIFNIGFFAGVIALALEGVICLP